MAKFKNVIFDFDSTLVTVEGLDEIARRNGKLAEINHITARSMDGEIPFSASLKKRFELLSPTLDDVIYLVEVYKKSYTKGALDLIENLKLSGCNIFVSTGGIKAAVIPAAMKLGINPDNVFAVCTKLDENKKLLLNNSCLMTKDYGKTQVVKKIMVTGDTLMIGDGMTDFEAGKHATKFIGFGGIVKRESVESFSKDYVTDKSIYKILDLC